MNLTAWTIAYNNDANLVRFNDSLTLSSPVRFKVLNQGDLPLDPNTVERLCACEEVVNWLKNKSLAKAWNRCVSQSSTDWVLISNDDIEFRTGWWESFREYSEEYLWLGCSHCFCIHKQLYEVVGSFDEGFSYLGYEDDDYLIRMEQSGLPIMYGASGFPYDGDRFAQFIVHHHCSRVNFGSNPNRDYFFSKWKHHLPYWRRERWFFL